MIEKLGDQVGELQKLHIKEFVRRIGRLAVVPRSFVRKRSDAAKSDTLLPIDSTCDAPAIDEYSGSDKVNDIRNQVATTQSSKPHDELTELIRQGNENFERAVKQIAALEPGVISMAIQKFRTDLMEAVYNRIVR